MKKIEEKQKRSVLAEGRNFGIGFSILNKISKDKYETYLPFTACKDYLNDFSYVEWTKDEIGSIHGYNHKLLNCFDNKRLFYLGVNTLHYKSSGDWNKKDEATKILIDNKDNLQSFINKIEDKIGICKSTITIDEDTLIFRSSVYWTKSTALISVFTLLIRCYFNIQLNDKDLIDQMKEHKVFIDADSYMKNSTIEFVENIGKYKYDKINYESLGVVKTSAGTVHNFGIVGYLSKMKNMK